MAQVQVGLPTTCRNVEEKRDFNISVADSEAVRMISSVHQGPPFLSCELRVGNQRAGTGMLFAYIPNIQKIPH